MLDDIPGIGEVRRKALMRHFKSIEDIRDADIEQLLAVDGIGRPQAEAIYEFFHNREGE